MKSFKNGFSGLALIVAAVVPAFTVYLVMRPKHSDPAPALVSTASAPFQQIGKAYQAKGNITDLNGAKAQATKALGSELTSAVSRQGGVIVSTVTAEGLVPASSSLLQSIQLTPSPASAFVRTVPQDRGGNPPLTAAEIHYDSYAGLRVAWQNQAESFHIGFAEWRTGPDGLRAASRLSRDVGGVTEEIPLTSSDAYFPASEVERLAPFPRFTFHTGAGMVNGRLRQVFLIQKHVARNLSLTTGYANGGPVLMVSYSWGKQ